MLLSRRGLIASLLAAPVIIRTPGLLMPVKRVSLVDTDNVFSILSNGDIVLKGESITPEISALFYQDQIVYQRGLDGWVAYKVVASSKKLRRVL